MTLRIPRRRISPRTKRRYKAIKNFVRRALGNPSQPDIKINSSIAINVTDLKYKIIGLEQQLDEVNQQCRDLVGVHSGTRDGSRLAVSERNQDDLFFKDRLLNEWDAKTQLLYKKSEQSKHWNDGHDAHKLDSNGTDSRHLHKKERKTNKKDRSYKNLRAINGSQPNLLKYQTQSSPDNLTSTLSSTSYCKPKYRRCVKSFRPVQERPHKHRKFRENIIPQEAIVKQLGEHNKTITPPKLSDHDLKHKKKLTRNVRPAIDQEFIAEIIKRQYKPIKMFKRESDMSRFSAPVCRDQENLARENNIERSELCSCYFEGCKKSKYKHRHELSDLHSVCDTRLYSAKRPSRRCYYRRYADMYNDSDFYDLIPVKEKASPKLKRKVAPEEFISYKEVPPSPRSHRPRLNLQAQYYDDFDDRIEQGRRQYKNDSPKRPLKFKSRVEYEESLTSEVVNGMKSKSRKNLNIAQVQHDGGNMSSLQSPLYNNANVANESPLNKTQETNSTDRTDKALNEIKDILQSFLKEIKKESTSQCCNSEATPKKVDKCCSEFNKGGCHFNSMTMPTSRQSVNNYGVPQYAFPPSFVPPFTNPCCYPVLCPMSCMQNILPSPSYTCPSCANNAKEDMSHKANVQDESNNIKTNNQTDELLKEIYKYVAHTPKSSQQDDIIVGNTQKLDVNNLSTCRIAGCSKAPKQDAKVGTQKIKCYSKSCEAISSRLMSDTRYTGVKTTYSDSLLETVSASETDANTDFTVKKQKSSKFVKVLRSLGLRKKKKDIIEELSESESTLEVEVKPKPKQKSPYRQEIKNYMVTGERYYRRPDIQSLHNPYRMAHDCLHARVSSPKCQNPEHLGPLSAEYGNYHPYHFPHDSPKSSFYNEFDPTASASPYHPSHPSAHLHSCQPQVPLCFKEIEVKSIGTQSERKVPFFSKFNKKSHEPTTTRMTYDFDAKNCSTQTAANAAPSFTPIKASKLGKYSWKALQAKINELDGPTDTGLKTQKQLADGDFKMRNAMLKKLFRKRNPFSPGNMIMRTLLGKDRSSFEEAHTVFRPRMFV